ncbi:hypothetical protein SLEP1_g43600 [Rubroshorea leprosula]|uniref:Reverse transcriptase domain-containing protein n=1 Tax=Rubroshorea leprosula TaxID=152421 RepID=A0AAV5LDG1_9ROSI|nr:hypothetical protein SLEP1_g43600 [Rubroshorea leprosula]
MKRQAFVFKADFEKAYDCVDWEFLDWMMSRFGFGTKWRRWIKECLSTARVSVLVNGSPTEEFQMGKGLRQGDPLSLFLFLMIGEGLHGLVKKAETVGMPVGGKPRSKEFWVPVVNKFRAKLAVWKSAMLSVGGHITLLNSECRIYVGEIGLYLGNGGLDWVMEWRIYGNRWLGRNIMEVDITGVESGRVSKIWSDVVKIGGMAVGLRNLLVNGFRWEVGDGKRVGFWREIWVGDKSLRDLFPRLYELVVKEEGLVSEMGDWEEDRWRWNMEWRRERKGRVRDEEEGLWELLESVQLKKGKEDHWWWIHGLDGQYVVKTAYEALAPIKCTLVDQFYKMIWCRLVPSKNNPLQVAIEAKRHKRLLKMFYKQTHGVV